MEYADTPGDNHLFARSRQHVIAHLQSRIGHCLCVIASCITWAGLPQLASADDYSPNSSLSVALARPMTSIVDGQAFRAGLERIAGQARVNIWLDRRVDPSRIIEVGAVGPTAFAALQKLAESQQCVVMPVENVLLIGRPDWVDQTLATLLTEATTRRSNARTIRWEDLTTPSEALVRIGDDVRGVRLPHDLWPAASLTAVQPRVAIALVLAQFDMKPRFTGSGVTFQVAEAARVPRIDRHYFPGRQTGEIRRLLEQLDPQHQITPAGNRLRVAASPSAHRQLIASLMQAQQPAGPDPDTDTFDLRKTTAPAIDLLKQLAASAGKKCVVEPDAAAACEARVTIEGKSVTLKQLVSSVAEQANVTAEWTGDSIIVRMKN